MGKLHCPGQSQISASLKVLETGGSIVLAQTFIFLFAFLFAPRYGIFKLKKLFAGYK